MCGGIGQKRHMPRVLQRDGQPTLVLGAGAGLAARLDLGALRDITAQAANILIIYLAHAVDAKRANLPPRAKIASTATKARATETFWPLWTVWAIWSFSALRTIGPVWTIHAGGAILWRAISPGLHQCVAPRNVWDCRFTGRRVSPPRRTGTYIIAPPYHGQSARRDA